MISCLYFKIMVCLSLKNFVSFDLSTHFLYLNMILFKIISVGRTFSFSKATLLCWRKSIIFHIMIHFFVMEHDTFLYLEIANVFYFKLESYFNIKWHVCNDCCENLCNIFLGINHVHIHLVLFDI